MDPDAPRRPMGNSGNYYESSPLTKLMDALRTYGGKMGDWSKMAGMAGSLVPKNTAAGGIVGGGLEGAGSGAKIGGTIGSFIPGIGTAVGTGVGAAVGAVAGAISGGSEWKEAQHQRQLQALWAMRNRMNG